MRRGILYIMVLAVAVFGMTSCMKDLGYILRQDVDAPISMELNGSRYEWDEELFSSDVGIYAMRNHPDLVLHDGGGFTFELRRTLACDSEKSAELYFCIENEYSEFELNKTYSLIVVGDSFAEVNFQERGPTHTLPSGTTVTDIITYSYDAKDGYILFTEMEKYSEHSYLLSGEFSFRGVSSDGDELVVKKGKFSDCRVHVSHGERCDGEW